MIWILDQTQLLSSGTVGAVSFVTVPVSLSLGEQLVLVIKLSNYRTDVYGFQASSVVIFQFNVNFLFNATISSTLQLTEILFALFNCPSGCS